MESGAAPDGTSAAQLAECCNIPLAEAVSFLEATDGSIPVCWSWAAVQLILLYRQPWICTSPQWLNKARSIVGIKTNPLPKGHDSAQVSGAARPPPTMIHFGHFSVDSIHSAMRTWLMVQVQKPQ